ncbi:MAG: hypothetical protein IKP37_02875 [Paludibacteraceae bacterium]|nr:hypothetical protein [Paludibacteraceae bacterium]
MEFTSPIFIGGGWDSRARVCLPGYGGTAFQAAEWEFSSPRALPPVIEIPSSRRSGIVDDSFVEGKRLLG